MELQVLCILSTRCFEHVYLQGRWRIDVVGCGVHQVLLVQRGSFVRWHLKSQMEKRVSQCFHPSNPPLLTLPHLVCVFALERERVFGVWRLLVHSLWGSGAGLPSNIHGEESGLSGLSSSPHTLCSLLTQTASLLSFQRYVSPCSPQHHLWSPSWPMADSPGGGGGEQMSQHGQQPHPERPPLKKRRVAPLCPSRGSYRQTFFRTSSSARSEQTRHGRRRNEGKQEVALTTCMTESVGVIVFLCVCVCVCVCVC